MKSRRVLTGAIAALALAAVPAIAADKVPERVGITVGTLGNPFFVPLVAGAKDTVAKAAPDADVTVIGADYDLNKQATQIDSFIASGVGLIMINSVDADASAPAEPRIHLPSMLDFRVRKAIQLMKANVCERISFDDVARSVGLSRPHFFALFKEQTNLTPNVYWNTLRMEEAVRQLQWSREPLISVACNLGFTTQGNFSRFFRDHVGVPPTLYREAARAVS